MSDSSSKGGCEEPSGASHPLGFVRALPDLVAVPQSRRGRILLAAGAVAVAAGAAALAPRAAATYQRQRILPPPVPEETPVAAPRRRPSGFVLALIAAVVVVAAPWTVPGLPHRIGDWLAPAAKSAPIKVADPKPLPVPSTQPAVPPPHSAYLSGQLQAWGTPTQLVVPRLQVNAPVVPIREQAGSLTPPSDPLMIGWWLQGPNPGDAQGTALLTGHTVHYGGGAFDHLDALVRGDRFRVRTARGVITYIVVGVRKYTTGALARDSQQLFRFTGAPRLLLVTCSNWNGSIYLNNTVVTGAPISEVLS